MTSTSTLIKVALAALGFACQIGHASIYTFPVNNFTYDDHMPNPATRAVGAIETSELGVFRGSEVIGVLMRSTYRAELYSGEKSLGLLSNENAIWEYGCGYRVSCLDPLATLTITPATMTFQYNGYRTEYFSDFLRLDNWYTTAPPGGYRKTMSVSFRDDFDSIFFDWDAINRAARPNDVRGNFVLTAQEIDEPSTAAALALGIAVLAFMRKKSPVI